MGRQMHFKTTDFKSIVEQVHEYENLVANMVVEGTQVNNVFLYDALIEKLPKSQLDLRTR